MTTQVNYAQSGVSCNRNFSTGFFTIAQDDAGSYKAWTSGSQTKVLLIK